MTIVFYSVSKNEWNVYLVTGRRQTLHLPIIESELVAWNPSGNIITPLFLQYILPDLLYSAF